MTREEILKTISDLLAKDEESIGDDPDFLNKDAPQWVKNAMREWARTMFPTHKVTGSNEPGELGSIAGQKLAFLKFLEEQKKEFINALKGLGVDTEDFDNPLEEEAPDVEPYGSIPKTLALSVELPHSAATEFFNAFAKALVKKPSDIRASNFQRTSTPIYFFSWFFGSKLKL